MTRIIIIIIMIPNDKLFELLKQPFLLMSIFSYKYTNNDNNINDNSNNNINNNTLAQTLGGWRASIIYYY
jgi:hypothetical protein